MRLVTAKDYDQMSRKASYIVASRVILNPKCVLGLATGDTPKGLYNELVRLFRAGDVDFSGVTTFNLDEYAGLSPENPQSYHSYMEEHLFRHIGERDAGHLLFRMRLHVGFVIGAGGV